MTTDVVVTFQGTIASVTPLTSAAREWVDEHVQLEGWQWFGRSFACEPRYVSNLVEGMRDAGLEVSA